MPAKKKKKPAAVKKSAKKRAPARAKKAKTSNVISFTELFELKKKRLAEAQQQQGWKNGSTGGVSVPFEQPKAVFNVRNGRTNGSGARHK